MKFTMNRQEIWDQINDSTWSNVRLHINSIFFGDSFFFTCKKFHDLYGKLRIVPDLNLYHEFY